MEKIACRLPQSGNICIAIKACIHIVTTKNRYNDATQAAIEVLYEVVLDPSKAHLYAIKTIGEVSAKEERVRAVYRYWFIHIVTHRQALGRH
jgi:hypothetical protein